MKMNHSVWNNVGYNTISRSVFYGILSAVLVWGFGMTYIISTMTATTTFSLGLLLLIGLGIPLIGIFLSATSNNPVISFIGFNLVIGGMSAILGPVLNMYSLKYDANIVTEAAVLTGAITLLMGASGVAFPRFYEKIGGALFVALLALVVVSLLGLFIPFFRFDWIVYPAAGLFALYIGYDMYRASIIPATVDNAVDVAVALYLDIINLFIRILEILARNSQD